MTTTYHTPPPTWESILLQALYEKYLQPIERLLHRKIAYWETLERTDRFGLSDQENQRLQRRMDDLATEILALDNLLHAVAEFATQYARHLDVLQSRLDLLNDLYLSTYDTSQHSQQRIINLLSRKAA